MPKTEQLTEAHVFGEPELQTHKSSQNDPNLTGTTTTQVGARKAPHPGPFDAENTQKF